MKTALNKHFNDLIREHEYSEITDHVGRELYHDGKKLRVSRVLAVPHGMYRDKSIVARAICAGKETEYSAFIYKGGKIEISSNHFEEK